MIALASDFDGTLFFGGSKEKFKPEDLSAIRNFQSTGGLFGVCTGRSLTGVLMESEKLLDFDFYILTSGAVILDKDRNTIVRSPIERALVRSLFADYFGKTEIVTQVDDCVYTMGKPYPLQLKVNSIDEIASENFYGVSIAAGNEAYASEIGAEINAMYGDKLTAFVNVTNVDIVSKGCSKGAALTVVKNYFGADKIGGVGDSYNDIPLIDAADLSFTFPYAPDRVRNRADYIVNSVSEAIEKLNK